MFLVMIAAVFAQTSPLPQSSRVATSNDDIVVTAERMRRFRVVTRRNRKTGESRCIIRRSSGRSDLDAAMCTATLACAAIATDAVSMTSCLNQRMSAIASEQSGGLPTAPTPPD